jgi:hypothetical protein
MIDRKTYNIVVETMDQTRRADVNLSPHTRVSEVLGLGKQNWKLPEDTDYALVNLRTGQQLAPGSTLAQQGVQEGDRLVVQPLFTAGAFAG